MIIVKMQKLLDLGINFVFMVLSSKLLRQSQLAKFCEQSLLFRYEFLPLLDFLEVSLA